MNHSPDEFSTRIKDICEKAFQRAIFISKTSDVGSAAITWLDMELPVNESGSARDNCLDLLGVDATGRYVLCELKFARKSKGHGSPSDANKQIRDYYRFLTEHIGTIKNELHTNARAKSIDEEAFKSQMPRLIVAANEKYWHVWRKEAFIDNGVEHYSIKIDPNEFLRQKGEAKEYDPKPPMSGLKWTRLD